MERLQHLHDIFAVLRIEVACWFVGKDERRVVHDGAGHGRALLLSAGELLGTMPGPGTQVDQLQRFPNEVAALRPGYALVEEGQFHIFVDVESMRLKL